MASGGAAREGAAASAVTLRHLGEYKDGHITMYTLELESGGEQFMVARRYRDLLAFHTRLLEKFGEHELPPFPPKEPLMQKMLSRGSDKRTGFAEERKAQLERYLTQLLQRGGALLTPAVHDFLEAPGALGARRARGPGGEPWSEVGAVLISGVRARPGGLPGDVEVVVRVQSAASCQVRLALRPLDGDESAASREPALNYGEGSVWHRCLHLDVPAGGGEVSHSLSLEPGTAWQVGTVCVVDGAATGNAAYVKLLAPAQGAVGAAGAPACAAADVPSMPTGTFLAAGLESMPTGTFVAADLQNMPTGTFVAADLLSMPTSTFVAADAEDARKGSVIDLTDDSADAPADSLEDEVEEPEVRQMSCTTFTVASPAGDEVGALGALPPVPAATFTVGGLAGGGGAHDGGAGAGATAEGREARGAAPPMPCATFTLPDAARVGAAADESAACSEAEDAAVSEAAASEAAAAAAAVPAPEQAAAAAAGAVAPRPADDAEGGADSEAAAEGEEAAGEAAAPGPAASEDGGGAGSEGAASEGAEADDAAPRPGPAPGRCWAAGAARPPARPRKEGREVHRVIGFQGVAAARYMKQVEESHKASIERVPHLFEAAGDGKKTSVNLKFSVVHSDHASAASGRPGAGAAAGPQQPEQCAGGFAPAEALDQSRRQQQLEQSREDEQAVARWVHAVTGDAGALAAAEGRRPLEEALQSGEALCDLVNAVWPGQIVGTVRGEAQGGRRLLNITRFVQACPRLGVRTEDLFAPPDLAEGKNLRSVVRCLFALAALAVSSPELQGQGLLEAKALAASKPG